MVDSFRRFIKQWRSGTRTLTLEERGAYGDVIDLIYESADGGILDDDNRVARDLRCDTRVWRRIKTKLIGLNRLYVVEGQIRNSVADRRLATEVAMALSAARNGALAGAVHNSKKVMKTESIRTGLGGRAG